MVSSKIPPGCGIYSSLYTYKRLPLCAKMSLLRTAQQWVPKNNFSALFEERCGVCSQFEVKDVAWDASLGAEKLDLILLNHFADEFQEKHGIDIRAFPKAVAKLKRQVCLACVPQPPCRIATCMGSHSMLWWVMLTVQRTYRCSCMQNKGVSCSLHKDALLWVPETLKMHATFA